MGDKTIKEKDRMTPSLPFKLAVAAAAIVWLASLPVVLLAIGFSGLEILSLPSLVIEIMKGDGNAWNRLWAWFVVLFPVTAILIFVSRRRRS